MAQPTPIKRNAQGGLKDTRVNRPDIVALLDECEDLRGEGAAYATSLRHSAGGDVEFTRKPGIRVGNTKRIE